MVAKFAKNVAAHAVEQSSWILFWSGVVVLAGASIDASFFHGNWVTLLATGLGATLMMSAGLATSSEISLTE